MCYLCLKDNPIDTIEITAKKRGKTAIEQLRVRAQLTKEFLKNIKDDEAEGWQRCHIGDGLIERLNEEQYRLARQL